VLLLVGLLAWLSMLGRGPFPEVCVGRDPYPESCGAGVAETTVKLASHATRMDECIFVCQERNVRKQTDERNDGCRRLPVYNEFTLRIHA